jgi:hypothetical protein
MPRANLGPADFQKALDDIGARYPALKLDDLFVLWFLRSYVTRSEEDAVEAVAGAQRDKGIDAIWIDEGARTVVVVQGKYHKSLGEKREKRADVISLAEVADQLSTLDEKKFRNYIETMDSLVANRLREARKKVVEQEYRVWLVFATLGKVSASIIKDAEAHLRAIQGEARLEVIDSNRAKALLRDYNDDVAPPIAAVDLEMEESDNVRVNGVSQRYDDKNQIESWVFSMRGDKIAQLFKYAGRQLFARNVRGFLGLQSLKSVNRSMAETLQGEPDRFFYYNNGITILCDKAERKGQKGHDILHVRNPQVINGQQTTRVLAAHPDLAARASVLVKVIQVAHRLSEESNFDDLLTQIVTGTNRQSHVDASDLLANDGVQIELERSLRKLGYGYIRKRQTKGEVKSELGGKHYHLIKKELFAQTVAACDIDPVLARTSKETLFHKDAYARILRSGDPFFYLPRYWLLQRVLKVVKGDQKQREARWLVVHFVWSRLSPLIKGVAKARRFSEQCLRQDQDLIDPLDAAIRKVVMAAGRFYAQNKGKGPDAVDASTFFKSKRSSAKTFNEFWEWPGNSPSVFEKWITKAANAVAS